MISELSQSPVKVWGHEFELRKVTIVTYFCPWLGCKSEVKLYLRGGAREYVDMLEERGAGN